MGQCVFFVRVCICLYQRKGWKRGGKRGENKKKERKERKAVPGLVRALPGCSHGVPIALLGAVGCRLTTQKGQKTPPARRVPGKEINRARNPCSPYPRPSPSRTPKRGRENSAKGKVTCHIRSPSPLEQRETGKMGPIPPILRRKRPDLPMQTFPSHLSHCTGEIVAELCKIMQEKSGMVPLILTEVACYIV